VIEFVNSHAVRIVKRIKPFAGHQMHDNAALFGIEITPTFQRGKPFLRTAVVQQNELCMS